MANKKKKKAEVEVRNLSVTELISIIDGMSQAQTQVQGNLASALAPICKKGVKLVTPEDASTDSSIASVLARIASRMQANLTSLDSLGRSINL
jgi:predicted DNA-binding ribbon-helix-helix protein